MLILTNFVAELGAVVGEELQGGLAIGTVLGDSGLDLAGVRAADSLRIGWVGLLAKCHQYQDSTGHSFHSFEHTR